ncbi:fluoride efflux transporter CrcB [Nakamurella antarctica]|uniref:Fluoride-specific ion channel FluC n=1 Tax=Nakamurella antarctica TaxID=1902245 RepID=A0A3G8ZPU4_9ACTN|nr:fluoride efflux transporter CrcB [Nakamurella antarctica]AZI59259.1 fluoride efflux transporter CrcB [Nakamurella antarctica]
MSSPHSPAALPAPTVAQAVAAVAAGGVIGAWLRYTVATAAPIAAGSFDWTTFAINVLGSFALGALISYLTQRRFRHPLWRPFLGTGLLGGFTTFSTYAVEAQSLLRVGHAVTAVLYLAGTLACAVVAALLGIALMRRALRA